MRAARRLTPAVIAILIALASITVQPSPATAADPSPTPLATTPAAPAPTVAPAAVPAPIAPPVVAAAVVAPPVAPAPTRAMVLAGKLQLVARIAISKLRGRYVFGAMGPNAFDCSGLVRYAYKKAGISSRLGGGHSARAMLMWGIVRHLTSRKNPQVGDVAIWGNGSHVGIYIGGGRVISALNPRSGIKITRVNALTTPFTAYIHTGH